MGIYSLRKVSSFKAWANLKKFDFQKLGSENQSEYQRIHLN